MSRIEGEPFVGADNVHQMVIFGTENAAFTTKAVLHHTDMVGVLRDIAGDVARTDWSAAQKLNIINIRATCALERIEKGEPA